MKKHPFRIVIGNGLVVIDCMNYKQMKKALRDYMCCYEFDVPTISIYALLNNEYVLFKEYRHYICVCVKVNTRGVDNIKKFEIFTTSKDKAINKAFDIYRKIYKQKPSYIVIE